MHLENNFVTLHILHRVKVGPSIKWLSKENIEPTEAQSRTGPQHRLQYQNLRSAQNSTQRRQPFIVHREDSTYEYLGKNVLHASLRSYWPSTQNGRLICFQWSLPSLLHIRLYACSVALLWGNLWLSLLWGNLSPSLLWGHCGHLWALFNNQSDGEFGDWLFW